MPDPALQYTAKAVREAVVSLVDRAFDAEGYAEVDSRVWVADVPDYAEDPWCLIEIIDLVPSTDAESKDCAAEAVFVNIELYATEQGTDTPYEAVEALAVQVVQRITAPDFSIEGHSVFNTRQNLAEPLSSTGPEQVDLFGRALQYQIDIE